MKKNKMDIRTWVYMALLIALSFVGSFIKIFQSIALDSLPGYFAAFYLGPIPGAIVAASGHIITAINSGFPSTLPIHLIIMIAMGIGAYLVGILFRKFNGIVACVAGVLFNGPILLGVLIPITTKLNMPVAGKAFFLMLIIPLVLASSVNIILAYIVYNIVENKL